MNHLTDYYFNENLLLKDKILKNISELIDKKDFILGTALSEFENSFAQYNGSQFAVGTSSGTSALKLALMALDLAKDDEVIVPAHTFISTALAVLEVGATLVLCDVDEKTFNIDTEKLQSLITPKTKVIIPVHLYGQMANLEEVKKIAGDSIAIIEDASQAHGAHRIINHQKKMSGSVGDFGCFSFYPTKNLGAMGDAGCILTSDKKVYEKLMALRNYGQFKKHDHEILGGNERLDTIQAIILSEKLKILNELNEKRRIVANWYFEEFKNMNLILPFIDTNNHHVFHQFVVRINNRNQVKEGLSKLGIDCGIHYPNPIHFHSCFKKLEIKMGDLVVSEKICNDILSLPMSPFITREHVEFIAREVKQFI